MKLLETITLPLVLHGTRSFASAKLQGQTVAEPPITTMKPLECNLYMAPSTLGEHTNMGMYTGVDLKENEVINWPEIAIPLLFREWGEHTEGFTDGRIWERYIWEGEVVNIEGYDDYDIHDSKAAFIPGIGCTINGALNMANLESTHGSTYDTAGLHRSRDPGSGAFTAYHSSVTNAAIDISAGSELFASYGADWVPYIPGAQVTFDNLMDKADEFLVTSYASFAMKQNDGLSDEMKEALWDFTTRDFPIYNEAMTNLPRYPWSDVEKFILDKNSKPEEMASITRHFFRKQHTRTLEWLQTHPNSYCQDHIRPKQSTIRQAGRGAFATRDLPAGTIVGYAPLIHVGKDGREIFTLEYKDEKGSFIKFDLIINYSFGHPNSTMILTPYGGMVNYINHAPTGKANVNIRFPERELVAHKPEWLNRDPEFFHHAVEKIGLSFEYVALRDIQEGEEVFMDYGPEWEKAWEEHVRNWQPPDGSENYVHSSLWKEPYLRTRDELETNPYPPNLHTMCISSYTEKDGEFFFVPPLTKDSPKRWYCEVVERLRDEEDGYIYDIELHIDENQDNSSSSEDENNEKDVVIVVKDVDPSAIFLTNKVFTNDWHLRNTFRHYIQIPDDVMPKAWQNGPDPIQLPGYVEVDSSE